jgi:hypothetical protein
VWWVFLLLLAKAEITIKFYNWTCGGGGGVGGAPVKAYEASLLLKIIIIIIIINYKL